MTAAQAGLDRPVEPVDLHPVMGLIGALWPNFGAGKTAAQKWQMIVAWESALDDIPVGLQVKAIRCKVQAGQVWPPNSPAEVRRRHPGTVEALGGLRQRQRLGDPVRLGL